MTKTSYGIISDIHASPPEVVAAAIGVLKHIGAQKLVFNGDLVGERFSEAKPKEYLATILAFAAASGLECFIQPGSHEEVKDYKPVMDACVGKMGSLVDCLKTPHVQAEDHDILFLPGSDWTAGGEYLLRNSEGLDILVSGYKQMPDGKIVHVSNMNDLRRQLESVRDPQKTIVFCHVPAKFSNGNRGVDFADFGEVTVDVPVGKNIIPAGTVIPWVVAQHYSQQGVPITHRQENRGNPYLATLFEELGIRKAINGHFHEASHNASTRNGEPVPEHESSDELFWNASYLDGGKVGLLEVNDGRVAFHNVQLENYLRGKTE